MISRSVIWIVWSVCLVGLFAGDVQDAAELRGKANDSDCRATPANVDEQGEVQRAVRWTCVPSPTVYEDFLAFLDRSRDVAFADHVVRRQLGALIPILPDSLVRRLRLKEAARSGDRSVLSLGAGTTLAEWWHSQDPFPATNRNERLEEHLQRTIYAFEHYTYENDEHRLDGRGQVYVRFGEPEEYEEIDIGNGYEAEFWVYPSFHEAAEYLFVRERGDGFMIGDPTDLLPPEARGGYGPTRRGTRKAIRGLGVLRGVYGTLAHYRSRYGPTYSDLSMYSERVSQAQTGVPADFVTRPHTFVQQKISEIKTDEAYAARKRDRVVPQSRTKVGERIEELPVAVRQVRTLKDDGTTEVDVYWSVRRSSIRPSSSLVETLDEVGVEPSSTYLMSCSVVQQSEAFERQNIHTDHVLVKVDARNHQPQAITPIRRIAFPLDEHTFRASVQVDAYWASVNQAEQYVRRHAKVKSGVYRFDSLRALQSDPSALEMSDLKPLLAAEEANLENAPVYPYHTLEPNSSLALGFEVYHLTLGEDDQTSYTVEYEMERETSRRGFRKLFRGDDRRTTTVENEVKGRSRTEKEFVWLDFNKWNLEDDQKIRVTVRVRDSLTGQQVERHIDFLMVR